MQSIYDTLEALEVACEGEQELLAYSAPELAEIIAAIKTMPEDERKQIHDRLERVSTIIEGKMMMYAEEITQLGGQLRALDSTSKARNAYRTVAVIPVNADASHQE